MRLQRRLAAAAAAVCALLALIDPITLVDLKALDGQWNLLRSAHARPAEDVVVIGIDERSLAAVREPLALWHRQFAELLFALGDAKPRVVGLDVVLPDRAFDEVVPGLDQALLRALLMTRASFPTILAITIDESRRPRAVYPAFIAAAGTAPGLALWPVDTDRVVRRFDEQLGEQGRNVETFVGRIARTVGMNPVAGYVDFSVGAPFRYVPFADVLEARRRGDQDWLRKTFEGRIVLVGSVLKFDDAVSIPVALAERTFAASETPGVLLNAQALRAFSSGRIVAPASAWWVALLALIGGLSAVASLRPAIQYAAATLTIAALLALSHLALRQGTFLPFAWPLAAVLWALAMSRGVEVVGALAERRHLRRSFAGYVSPAVMREILERRIRPEGGGELRHVCALFSDMRGYTPRSEKMTPHESIAFLNRYFEGVVPAIHAQGGTVISFAGDGIMAVFGAPQDDPNPCESAFQASLGILEFLRGLNERFLVEGIEPLAIGIGLHAGPAVVGHVGSGQRHDYTAIGDAINVASRLEGATKEAGYRIVCSKEVAERLRDRGSLAPLGPVAIKGHAPVECFGYARVEPETRVNRIEEVMA
jgi:adenylate cyclase